MENQAKINEYINAINEYIENEENETDIRDILNNETYASIEDFGKLSSMLYSLFEIEILEIADELTYTLTQTVNKDIYTVICWTEHPYTYETIEDIAKHVHQIIENNSIKV